MRLLEVENLKVVFRMKGTAVKTAVAGNSFFLDRGEVLAIVGESGSGKTVTGLAVIQELDHNAAIKDGRVLYKGRNLLELSVKEMRHVKRREIGMMFQNPATSLNPIMKVGKQLGETLSNTKPLTRVKEKFFAAKRGADENDRIIKKALKDVEIHDADLRAEHFPFTMSGGMQQRAQIAMNIIREGASVLIADEPTTALDVTTQAKILELLRSLAKAKNMGVILITHNLGIVAEYADRVAVMKDGEIVEQNDVFSIFQNPAHPYTRSLLEAVPRIDAPPRINKIASREAGERILEVQDLRVHRPITRNVAGPIQQTIATVKAVDGIDLLVRKNEAVGVVGETGCGKTTLADAIMGFVPATSGRIVVNGQDMTLPKVPDKERQATRGRKIGLVFQESADALDPQKSIMDSIIEGFSIHGMFSSDERRRRAVELAELVGLAEEVRQDSVFLSRRPTELSSGQRQRACVARALALEPELLILDEPVASLDVLVQSRIIDLLVGLREKLSTSFLFISHDIAVVKDVTDRVMVMYMGKIVEEGSSKGIIQNPLHPYTRALISAIPIPDPVAARGRKRMPLGGELPSPTNLPSGCRFRTRCPFATDLCAEETPPLRQYAERHFAACHYTKEIKEEMDDSINVN